MIIESFNTVETQQSLLGSSFALGSSTIGFKTYSPASNTLQTIAPSYLYQEYADDADLQAFVTAYNQYAQSYLDWFNTTSLPIYTQPAISGALLDWVASGIYNYPRPFLVTQSISGRPQSAYGTSAYGILAYGIRKQPITRGTSIIVNDDIYKRALTWQAYLGDGKQMTIQWIKRRIARFLYGNGGLDSNVSNLQNISVAFTSVLNTVGFYGSSFYGKSAYGTRKKTSITQNTITIKLPNLPLSSTLQILMQNGLLALPFQVKLSVILS